MNRTEPNSSTRRDSELSKVFHELHFSRRGREGHKERQILRFPNLRAAIGEIRSHFREDFFVLVLVLDLARTKLKDARGADRISGSSRTLGRKTFEDEDDDEGRGRLVAASPHCDLCGLAVKFSPLSCSLGLLPINPANETLRQPEDGPIVPTCRFDVLRIFPRKRKEQ